MPEELKDVTQGECELHGGELHEFTAYISGAHFEREVIKYVVIDGQAIAEGDIVLGTPEGVRQASQEVETCLDKLSSGEEIKLVAPFGVIVGGERFRWPSPRIPYSIDSGMSNTSRKQRAIDHWQSVTPVRFVQRTSSGKDYIHFTASSKCSSTVGRVGGNNRPPLLTQ